MKTLEKLKGSFRTSSEETTETSEDDSTESLSAVTIPNLINYYGEKGARGANIDINQIVGQLKTLALEGIECLNGQDYGEIVKEIKMKRAGS